MLRNLRFNSRRQAPAFFLLSVIVLTLLFTSNAHGAVEYGIAANYPGDTGIENDTSFIFRENFEETSIAAMAARWEDISNQNLMSFNADKPSASAGAKSVFFNGEAHLYRRLLPGYDQLYIRFYAKFDPVCNNIHHFVHMGGFNPSLPYPYPRAGIRPVGNERWTTGIEPMGNSWAWDFYSYWMHMRSNPDTRYWGNSFSGRPSPYTVSKNEWISVEFMVKMNNPVTSYNGEQAFWINGEKKNHLGQGFPRGEWIWDGFYPNSSCTPTATCDQNGSATPCCQDFEGFQWRSDSALNINFLWLLHYVDTDPSCTVKFDDVVVATQYIGPIVASTGGGGGGGNTPPPSSNSGGSSDSGGGSGGGCGFVNGKGQKAKGGGLALMTMFFLLLILFRIKKKNQYERLKAGIAKTMLFFIATAFILLLFAGISQAADYYVSPTGTAAWANCSGSTPLNGTSACSWQTAMANAVAGDTVYYRGGTYEPGTITNYEIPAMNPANSGTVGNYITFQAYPGETAIIHDANPGGADKVAAIGAYNRSYIIWDGFTLDRNLDDGLLASSIVRIGGSNHIIIRNCDIIGRPHKDQYNGSLISVPSGSSYVDIYNNKLHGVSADPNPIAPVVSASAIWVFDASYVNIYNNDIHDNNLGVGMKVNPRYVNVYKNHFYNCDKAAVKITPETSGVTDFNVYQNLIRNCAIALDSPDPPTLLYNLKMYNNTVYNMGAANGVVIDNVSYPNNRNSEVYNNIFYHGGSGSIWERFGTGVNRPAYADNNLFYGAGIWRRDNNVDYSTIASWRTATGFDLNSLTSNPLFVNPGGISPDDYNLSANSPARTSGRGGNYASVMGVYITGNETIGYDPDAPRVEITSPSSSTITTSNTTITLQGTATDTLGTNPGIVSVTWSNDRGGSGAAWSGAATATVNWTISNISLQSGQNIIMVTATDGDNKTGIDTLIVNPTTSGGGNTPPPSSGGGSGGDSSASGGGGCGFVKDINGKGQKAKGEGLALIIMLLLSLAGIYIARRLVKAKGRF